jgi:molecular chaperone DnaJ
MRLEQDYYEVLGVRRDATGDEIKRAFRALARRLHPDVAAVDDGEGFHDLVAAYEVLSHPRRRSLYDRLGLGARRRPVARPAPAVPPVEVALEWYEAERGAAKPLEFEETLPCADCRGRGLARGVVPGECVRCRGTGHLSSVRESPVARLLDIRTCPTCEGRGHEPAPACPACAGTGITTAARTVRVRFPAGVSDGDLVRVDGVARNFRVSVGSRPRDSRVLLGLAAGALVCALALLLFLLFS